VSLSFEARINRNENENIYTFLTLHFFVLFCLATFGSLGYLGKTCRDIEQCTSCFDYSTGSVVRNWEDRLSKLRSICEALEATCTATSVPPYIQRTKHVCNGTFRMLTEMLLKLCARACAFYLLKNHNEPNIPS
jgi:hypothetical protein